MLAGSHCPVCDVLPSLLVPNHGLGEMAEAAARTFAPDLSPLRDDEELDAGECDAHPVAVVEKAPEDQIAQTLERAQWCLAAAEEVECGLPVVEEALAALDASKSAAIVAFDEDVAAITASLATKRAQFAHAVRAQHLERSKAIACLQDSLTVGAQSVACVCHPV